MIKISDDMHSQINLVKLSEDFNRHLEHPMEPRKRKKKAWKLAFDPVELEKEHENLKMEDFALSEKKLKQYALACSSLRESIRNKAIEHESS